MKDIAVIAYHQSDCVSHAGAANEVELIMPQLRAVFDQVGLNNAQDVDFVCSGSCDYLQGAAFAFVAGVDALGAVPPIKESHVEMDAAWALYESILKIRMGHAESALIYGFGKSSPGELPIVLSQQLDPYYLAPQWVDTVSLAAMQERARDEIVTQSDHLSWYHLSSTLESYMLHQSQKFTKRFDANTYLRILDAWQRLDLAAETGSRTLDEAFVKCRNHKFLVFSIDSDVCFYPEEQSELMDRLKQAGADATRITVHTEKGHDSFLLEPGLYRPYIRAFLLEDI